MGFIDYVVDYFKGPKGDDGSPGEAGPAGPPLEVYTEQIVLTDNSSGEVQSHTVTYPAGKVVAGGFVLGDHSAASYFSFDADYTSSSTYFEYTYSGSHPGPDITLQLVTFLRDA